MARPYENEIKTFDSTYLYALDSPINELTSFLNYSHNTPLYVIGSGGSFTVAAFTAMLHQQTGTMAKCITPLEFMNYENIDKDNSILIVTAGGNNKDILSAFDKAITSELKILGILCASINNKLTKKAELVPRVFLNQTKLPIKKDGFLATNSLIALSLWLFRAYIENFSLNITLPNKLSELIHPHTDIINFKKTLEKKLYGFENVFTILVLYDNIGKTAAIDLESKLIEAGLNNVQLADYRNFAHGRHNWIDKNPKQIGIISLINPECITLAEKTLNLIPKNIPIAKIDTEYSGPLGALSLLIQVMYTVKIFGDYRKIDPGRPGVATFGKKIYHLGMPKIKKYPKIENMAIIRKFGISNDPKIHEQRLQSLNKFIIRLESIIFDCVALDYDGTICDLSNRYNSPSKQTIELLSKLLENNIPIAIATGRGKSVRKELQKIIPKKFWSKVLIGYYNCADIATLDEGDKPNINLQTDSSLIKFFNYLKQQQIVPNTINYTERPNQISLSSKHISALDLIKINSTNSKIFDSIKIVESSHSMDILTKNTSKLNILKEMKKIFNCENILCIGDRGSWPGNDYELLSTPYSLSVDEVNKDPNSCWNIAPPGSKGEQALQHYFNFIVLHNNKFKLNIRMMLNKYE